MSRFRSINLIRSLSDAVVLTWRVRPVLVRQAGMKIRVLTTLTRYSPAFIFVLNPLVTLSIFFPRFPPRFFRLSVALTLVKPLYRNNESDSRRVSQAKPRKDELHWHSTEIVLNAREICINSEKLPSFIANEIGSG